MKDRSFNRLYVIFVVLLIVILSDKTFGQSDKLNVCDGVRALVLVDSLYVGVKNDSETVASLKPEENSYFSAIIRYDFRTGFISLVQYSALTEYDFMYKSLVWDYKTGRKWVLKEGKTYYGEGYIAPIVFHYNSAHNTAIIQNYGWEWSWITYLSDGKEEKILNLNDDLVGILALISDNRIIIEATYYGLERPPNYFIYSWDTKQLTKLTSNDLPDYKREILRDSGSNISFVRSQPYYKEKKYFDGIFWNPQGTAFIFTKYDPLTPIKRRLYLYDYPNKAQKLMSKNHIAYAVIWRNDNDDDEH